MNLIHSSKIRYIAGIVLVCFAFSPILFVFAEDESSGTENTKKPVNQPSTATESVPADTISPEDPNTADTPEDMDDISDPNAIDDLDDIFDIKVSTYFLINQAYERIFTPKLITENGRVDYSRLKRLRHDVIAAEKNLKKLNPAVLWALSEDQRMAFWINTYNFGMIDAILRHYPIEPKWWNILYPDNSVMQITGAWEKVFFEIQQDEYNLKEIEKKYLIDPYKDPRICFALHNATIGGPLLRNEPYTGHNIDEQIDEQIKKYLKMPQGLHIDQQANIVYVSNVFRMKKNVFLDSEYVTILKFRSRNDEERAWLNFIFKYVDEEDKIYLENNDFEIKTIEFNWELNEKK